MRKILAILNARAGTFLDGQVPDPAGTLKRAFSARGDRVDVVLAKPRSIGDHLRQAKVSDHDTILIGGGDGTVGRALSILTDSDKTLGVLPLGTINILARDLGIPFPYEQAVETLAAAEPMRIDLGLINGKPFHSVCGLGYFAHVARARERLRDLSLPVLGRHAAWAMSHFRAFRQSGRFTVMVETGGDAHVLDAYAVLVTANRFGGTDWRRANLDGGLIEIHVAKDVSMLRRAMLGRDLVTGAWRDNPDIETFAARSFMISGTRPRRWITRDGELFYERTPMRFQVKPKAVTVLKARSAEA